MYAIVTANSGELDLNYLDLIAFHRISDTEYICKINDSAELRSTWQIKSQSDWDAVNAPTLDQVKQSKMAELNQSYQSCFSTFQSNALGTVKTYPINGEAQDNLKDLQQRLIADPNKNNFDFLTMEDGLLVSHTRIQFLELLQDAETFEVTLHNKYRGYANQVTVATDIPTVQSIKWT